MRSETRCFAVAIASRNGGAGTGNQVVSVGGPVVSQASGMGVRNVVVTAVELLSGIPSVVFGLLLLAAAVGVWWLGVRTMEGQS